MALAIRGRLRIVSCYLLTCALALPSAATPAEVVPEYQLKAEFLERFTRFIDWPAESSVSDPRAPFIIGVLGDDPFGNYLNDLASNRKIKGKRVVVRRLAEIDRVTECQVLFISATEKKNLASVLARTAARPILTVGDSEGFGDAGVLINFFKSGDRIRFEVNAAAAERSRLKLKAKLLKLARIVGEEDER